MARYSEKDEYDKMLDKIFIVIGIFVAMVVIFTIYSTYEVFQNDQRGYKVLYDGDNHMTLRVYNEKGHRYVDELQDSGWKIAGNPDSSSRGAWSDFTLVRDEN